MLKRQFIRYLVIGGTAYLIEMGSLYLLSVVFKLTGVVCVAISFWIGFSAAFILQKWIVFQNHEKGVRTLTKQLIAYGLLTIWNYSFTLGVVALFSSFTSVFIIRTVAIVIITGWNFTIYRIIFKELSAKPTDS